MIFSARPAPNRDAVVLRSVRQALNTPVVVISELPVGPATAAIAVHDDAQQGFPHLTLAVRSERSRVVVFFGTQEAAESTEASHAEDAVLSLAEGMGFLFDEGWMDAASSTVGSDAERVWEVFASGACPSMPPSTPAPAAADAPQPAPYSPEHLLTKFRHTLPWHPDQAGRFDRHSPAWVTAESGVADEFKELESQLAHRGDG